jgi:hypothetical protein
MDEGFSEGVGVFEDVSSLGVDSGSAVGVGTSLVAAGPSVDAGGGCPPPSPGEEQETTSASAIATPREELARIRVQDMAFTAEVLSAGQGGHAVVVPQEVAATFSTKRPAVVGTVNGTEYRSRLMVYGGKSYLGLRKDLLRSIGATAGDTVEIELSEDRTERTERVVTVPPELLEALAANPEARKAYDTLAYSHRLEYVRWISEGKQAETRATRTAKTIRRLLEKS